jgi:uncharacterized protein GlcG (DUF336 family)
MLTIKRLSLSDAKVMLEGAERKAKEIGVPMCIAVVDDSGTLIALSRMDGAKVTAVHLAIDKAFTAAAAKRATHIYNELCVPGKPGFGLHTSHDGRFSIVGGGLPVVVDEEIVGGIGASTGTPQEDQAVSQAGIDHLLSTLKKG